MGKGLAITQRCNEKWNPPAPKFFKINFGASYHQKTGTGGWECVVRNNRGDVLEVGFGELQKAFKSFARRSDRSSVQLGMTHVVMQTDASVHGEALVGVVRSFV